MDIALQELPTGAGRRLVAESLYPVLWNWKLNLFIFLWTFVVATISYKFVHLSLLVFFIGLDKNKYRCSKRSYPSNYT